MQHIVHPERGADGSPGPVTRGRTLARGKFLFVGDEKFYVRGVTYGTFRPGNDGHQFPNRDIVRCDFTAMQKHGVNALRTYTVPPGWLLDEASRHNLRVMVGLPWEQHIAFLDDAERVRSIEQRVRDGVRSCAGHEAVLCYAVGNEIPAPIVRWYGRRRVEKFLRRLCTIVRTEDPRALVTYVNYPSTEYLQLPFLDFVSFNIYLESPRALDSYIARLQNIAGDRPLILAEVGLDSRRNGEAVQATTLEWQIRQTFDGGCAGVFLFSWTDEWHRGGCEIEDWDFGLTTRTRVPKPSLAAVHRAFQEVPSLRLDSYPRISVAVCTYNAANTIGETLETLQHLDYPDYEVIFVNDGSTDATLSIAQQFTVRIINTEQKGLSHARNVAMQAATGEIVAYIDSDAYPDPHWLKHLAFTFQQTGYAGVGGPNILPFTDGEIAECVANAPGGPIHVLLSDREAEHIPGCNMAFRKSSLEAVGGFDTQFRSAGDDVDICWKLQEKGWNLGFSPAAVVWHHRRGSIWAYWKQQQGYGKAEALLERKWPEKYNRMGHLTWKGRLYGSIHDQHLWFLRWRVYHGTWGSGLFQSLYAPPTGQVLAMPFMPEWYLMVVALAIFATLTEWWLPMQYAIPVLVVALAVPVIQAAYSAAHARFFRKPRSRVVKFRMTLVTTLLYLLQPIARLIGRLKQGLTPWRRRTIAGYALPLPRQFVFWREQWESAERTLESLETLLHDEGAFVFRGGDFDTWDLEIRVGTTGEIRVLMAIEEHGSGKQLVRFRSWPVGSTKRLVIAIVCALLAIGPLISGSWVAAVFLGGVAVFLGSLAFIDCSAAMFALRRAIKILGTRYE